MNNLRAARPRFPACVLALTLASCPAIAQESTKSHVEPSRDISRERLIETLKSIPTSRAALGDAASQAGLVQTEDLLIKALTDAGVTPVTQSFNWALPARHFGDAPGDAPPPDAAPPKDPPLHAWRNIIVDLPGTDLAHEVLLVSAHIDAVPGAPGADDDGTGAAAIVELARRFAHTAHRRTLRLCLFNLEEVGLVGSTRYVLDWTQKHPSKPAPSTKDNDSKSPDAKADSPAGERIIGMVSLEMLGYFSDAPNSQKSPIPAIKGVFEPPTVGDAIVMVGLKRDDAFISKFSGSMAKAQPDLKVLTLDFFTFPMPDIMRSDHRDFVMAGIPGAMLTDTANFRNPHYHQPTDTIDTLDLDRYTKVVKAVAGAIDAIAEPAP